MVGAVPAVLLASEYLGAPLSLWGGSGVVEAPDGLSGRHAHAGDKHQWPGRDEDRPLSVPGHREAHGLLARLRDYPISRILTSPAVRCVQTVEPLSLRRAVPIEVVDALRVDSPVEGLLELVTDPRLETAVLCGHGEQIGALVGC
jgi:phosphohistidine phosphatase SixA